MSSKNVTIGDVNATADDVHRVRVTDSTMEIDQCGPKIDEGLYSRQLYVMGREAQMRMGTASEFLEYFTKEYEGEISMLSYGATILYAMYSQKSRSKERMEMKMSTLVETVTKKPIDANLKYLILEVCATDADDEDLELPKRVRVTPAMTMFQVVEAARGDFDLDANAAVELLHRGRPVDLSVPFRLTGISNNATLELRVLAPGSDVQRVRVALQLLDGRRVQEAFTNDTTLKAILEKWSLLGDFSLNFLQREITSDAFATTTLRVEDVEMSEVTTALPTPMSSFDALQLLRDNCFDVVSRTAVITLMKVVTNLLSYPVLVDTLKSKQEQLLQSAEKPPRNVKVMFPGELGGTAPAASRDELEGEDERPGDMALVMASMKARRSELEKAQNFRTQAMRELDELKRKKVFQSTLIRVQFSDRDEETAASEKKSATAAAAQAAMKRAGSESKGKSGKRPAWLKL
ncbi:hypothetical protein P43SY_001214 [Pythium insidiosum]|uniref:Ubiquitin-activating enzyme E1 C-terminal domain-containing protein n=1 Tax=Pythium insidiosum TaxID=114742 RepID=A0AAD5M7S9_PYTIN|nr:hypothetical protein P43SY_001214 [Pythium insidiosum]